MTSLRFAVLPLCLLLAAPAAAEKDPHNGSSQQQVPGTGSSQYTQLAQPSGSGGSGSGPSLSVVMPIVVIPTGTGGSTAGKTPPSPGGGGPSQGSGGGSGVSGGQGVPKQASGGVYSAPAAGHKVVGDGVDNGGPLGSGARFNAPDMPAPAPAAGFNAAENSAGAPAAQRGAPGPNPLEKVVGDIAALPEARTPERKKSDALVQQAKTQFMMGGGLDKALDTLSQAIKMDPANERAFVRRAEVENKLRRHDDALADAKQAIRLDAKDGDAWDQAAWAHFRSGRYKEAVDAASRALELDPNNAFALAIRARAKWALGDKDGALADARAAAALDGRFARLADDMSSGTFRDQGDLLGGGDAAQAAPSAGGLPPWAPWAGLGAALLALMGAAFAWLARKAQKRRTFSALASAPTMPATSAGGRLAGKYELTRLIGKGGMGSVHEALDHSLKRKVAVKKMLDGLAEVNPQARELLLKEAQTVAALHHSAIVDIHEIVEDGQDLYLVFELVTGKTLSQLLTESGRLPLSRCAEILKPVCDALQFAHKRELVHRDLKPGNIMIGEDGQVKLMDFGIARGTGVAAAEPGRTPQKSGQTQGPVLAHTRMVMGTPLYMAPEMDFGVVCKEGDVYALGVCLYEMLTGIPPFQSSDDKQALRWTPPSSLVAGLTHRVDQLLLRALQPDPAHRLRTPLAFWAALQAATQPGSTPPDAAVLPAKA